MDRVHYKVSGIANENMKTQLKNSLEKSRRGKSSLCRYGKRNNRSDL